MADNRLFNSHIKNDKLLLVIEELKKIRDCPKYSIVESLAIMALTQNKKKFLREFLDDDTHEINKEAFDFILSL